jgi:ubiquitin-conjugating enzyme E2 Z
MTQYDGGWFTIRLIFPRTFPHSLPRVRFLTPFFHANVTADGIPYYRPTKPDVPSAHVDSVIALFEKEMNPEPSCVLNRECAEMFWSRGEVGRKEFGRRVRRIVARSVEFEVEGEV